MRRLTMSRCHTDCSMVFLAGLNKAGYQSRTQCMAGHSKLKVPHIMKSMQIAPLAKALGLGNPVRWANTWAASGPPLRRKKHAHAASTERLHH